MQLALVPFCDFFFCMFFNFFFKIRILFTVLFLSFLFFNVFLCMLSMGFCLK